MPLSENILIRPHMNLAEIKEYIDQSFHEKVTPKQQVLKITKSNRLSTLSLQQMLLLGASILAIHAAFLCCQSLSLGEQANRWCRLNNLHYQQQKVMKASQNSVKQCQRWSHMLEGLSKLPLYASHCEITSEELHLSGYFQPNAEASAAEAIEELSLAEKPVLILPLEGKPFHIESTW